MPYNLPFGINYPDRNIHGLFNRKFDIVAFLDFNLSRKALRAGCLLVSPNLLSIAGSMFFLAHFVSPFASSHNPSHKRHSGNHKGYGHNSFGSGFSYPKNILARLSSVPARYFLIFSSISALVRDFKYPRENKNACNMTTLLVSYSLKLRHLNLSINSEALI